MESHGALRAMVSSVQAKIVAVVLFAVVGVGVVLTANGTSSTTAALEDRALAEVEALATRESNLLTIPMSLPATDVAVLQGMPPIQGMFRSAANGGVDPMDGSLLEQWYSRYATILSVFGDSRPNYTSLTLVMADGQEVVSVTRDASGEMVRVDDDELVDGRADDWFVEALAWADDGPWVSDTDTSGSVPVMATGVPLANDTTGDVGAVLLIEQQLDEVFAGIQARSTSEIQQILIDDRGVYLSHPDGAKVGAEAVVDYGETTPAIIADIGGAHIADGHVVAHEPVYLSGTADGRYWSVVRQTPTDLALSAVADFRNRSILLAIVTLIIASVIAGVLARRSIARPLKQTVAGLQRVSNGDLAVDFHTRSSDEVGQMAAALRSALDSVGSTLTQVGDNGNALGDSANSLASLSEEMTVAARDTADEAGAVASVSEQIAANSDAVASSMNQMLESIDEISRSTNEAAGITAQAVDVAGRVTSRMERLDASAVDIGNVIEMITMIAEQTNLLALNATIEAARVGEAGKGFAVVANEVKELAQQTAMATEEIQEKVGAIQGEAREAVDAIAEVNGLVESVNEASTTIAGAVEEQSVTTVEVSRSIKAVIDATQSISERIAIVAASAEATTDGASTAQNEAADLSQMALRLNELLARFTVPSQGKTADADPRSEVEMASA